MAVLCGDCSVSNPKPPWHARHGCSVGHDRDPPVRRPHPGRLLERQSDSSRVHACGLRVLSRTWRTCTSGGFVVSCCLTSALQTRTMSLALSFDLGTAHSSIHGSVIVKSSNSFTFNLCERLWALVVGSLAGSASWPRPQSRRSSRCGMPSCCQRHCVTSWTRSTTHRSSCHFHSSHSYRTSL